MRAAAFAALLVLVGCLPVVDGDSETALLSLEVIDAPPALTTDGGDPLFGVRFQVAPDAADAPAYDVSELHVEIVAQHRQFASLWNVRYDLYDDRNGDRRFGPGDILAVWERSRNVLSPADRGAYQVRLMCGSHLLGATEWLAR
ncbi:MAG: hypothetical protein QM765_12585 [Myxococcales bacterium]